MAIVTLHLSTVKAYTDSRPSRCPQCENGLLQRWGGSYKPVRDTQIRAAIVYRYRCTGCRRTFRHYLEGFGQADQSIRLVQLAAIGWTLGLSLRGMSAILSAFGVALAQIEESDTHAVVEWMQPLVEQLGVEMIVTDDLVSLGVAVERVGCQRQICRFHALRWIGHTIKELRSQFDEDWQESLDEIQRIVHDMPPAVSCQRCLYMLWQRFRGIDPPPFLVPLLMLAFEASRSAELRLLWT